MRVLLAFLGAAGLASTWFGLTGPPRSRSLLSVLQGWLGAGPGAPRAGHAMALSMMAGLAVLTIVAGMTGSATVALAVAIPAAGVPLVSLRGRARRRRMALQAEWPDVIALLISAVRSGVSLPEALAALAERGPPELAPAFASFSRSLRATGGFSESLQELREALADPTADRICVALELAHEVGGPDLIRVLRALASFTREDVKVRREIQARWSWTTSAARVAAGAPGAVLFLMALRPEAASAYSTPEGSVVICAGAAATLLGYRLMLRAARLPEGSRLR